MATKMNFSDKVVVGAVTMNGVIAVVQKVLAAIEPILGSIVSLGQAAIAVGTAVWIYFRVRGARLDNKNKELDAKLKEKELKQ